MKHTVIALLAASSALLAGAQVVEVQSVAKVPVSGNLQVNIARVSPDGSFAVVSDLSGNGLYRVDLSGGKPLQVASQGSALELSFTPDGSTIVYKSSETRSNHLRFHSVETVDLASGRVKTLAPAARHAANYTVSPSGVLSINASGRFSARDAQGKKTTEGQAIVGINRGHLEVTTSDGTTRFIDPQGKGSYLWPSLSPDGTKIVYYLSGSGCYVCNLDGSNPQPIGYVHGARWLGNDALVGFQDYDNGQWTTASAIVAADLKGTIQTLTDDSVIAMYPSASADAKTITFSTPDGQLYKITLK